MMKLFIVVAFFFGFVFGDSSYEKSYKSELGTVFKGSHKDRILNFSFFGDSKLISSANDNTVKVWSIKEQELLREIKVDGNLKKASFSSDGTKIYILTATKFSMLDAFSYREIHYIKGERYEDFAVVNDDKKLLLVSGYETKIYDIRDGRELHSIKNNNYAYHIDASPSEKYFAVASSGHVKIYNTQSASFISELPYNSNTILRTQFVDDKHVSTSDYKGGYLYNFKTSELLYGTKDYQNNYVKSFLVLDNLSSALLVNYQDATIKLLNLQTKEKYKHAQIDSYALVGYGLEVSKSGRYLAVGQDNGNFKLYSTNGFLGVRTQNRETVQVVDERAEQPIVIIKERVIIKEVEAPRVNQPPKLTLEASVKEGVIPLRVDFSIVATDDKKIESYYINFAGQEKMEKGTPPSTITKIFKSAGEYKVVVVVKDEEGEIATKSVVILPREQTFSDFKKMHQ